MNINEIRNLKNEGVYLVKYKSLFGDKEKEKVCTLTGISRNGEMLFFDTDFFSGGLKIKRIIKMKFLGADKFETRKKRLINKMEKKK